jgi:hypothetical protein
MRSRLVLCLVFLPPVPALAQGPDPAAFVRDLYVRYAGIEPQLRDVQFWVDKLQRGTEPNEVIANVLGSEQAYMRSRRNDEVWVTNLYVDILGRPPEPGASAQWLRGLRDFKGDRVKLAREFLKAAGGELNSGGRPPGMNRPEDLPGLLASTTQLMYQTARTECPNAVGWIIREQARNLATATADARPILMNPAANPTLYTQTLTNLDSGFANFRTALARTQLPAQSTRLHLEQATQTLAAISQSGVQPFPPVFPPGLGVPGGISRVDARRLAPFAAEMARDATSAAATFRTIYRNNWNTTTLVNQVEAYAREADTLRSDLRVGYPMAEFANRLMALNQTANAISAVVVKGGVDVRAYQAWYQATASMNEFTRQAGGGRPPGPFPPGPGPGPGPLPGVSPVPPQAFVAIDQATAHCDSLIPALGPYTFYSRAVPRLISDVQDIRNKYVSLRQTAATNPNRRELQRQIDAIAARFRSANGNYQEAVRDPRLRNMPDLNELAAAAHVVNQLIAIPR